MNKKRSGFTLIELLVVISIIAVLMSIMMPALQNVREQAKCTVCQTNQKNLALAWYMYQSDNNGRLVRAHSCRSNGQPGSDKYFKNAEDYFCWVELPQKDDPQHSRADYSPTEEDEIRGIKRGLLFSYVGDNIDVYHCPSDRRLKSGKTGYRSYSIPGCMNGDYTKGNVRGLKRITQIRRPSEKYMMVEEFGFAQGYNRDAWQLDPLNETWRDPLAVAHNGKSTLGFADGHGEKHKWRDESTIQFANREISGIDVDDSEDLRYMLDHWSK